MTTCKAAPTKKQAVEKVKKYIKDYPIIGVLNLSTLPSGTYARMRAKLRGQAEFVMARKTLMERALKESNLPNIDALIQKLTGVPALLFTKSNPFAIFKTIKKGKTSAPAKGGQIAPRDIILPAGPTQFPPGPIISEFAQLGVPAGVEAGKVAIKKDTTVIKEGQAFSHQLAAMLQKLNILPMELGLDLAAVYEKGILYGKSVLDVDEKQFMENLQSAAGEGFNLAIEIGHLAKDTIEPLLQKASREARALGMEANVMAPELIEELLAKGQNQARSVAQTGNIDTH